MGTSVRAEAVEVLGEGVVDAWRSQSTCGWVCSACGVALPNRGDHGVVDHIDDCTRVVTALAIDHRSKTYGRQ